MRVTDADFAGLDFTPRLPGGWSLIVTGWHPATINQLLAGRWQAAKLKKRDRRIVGFNAIYPPIPKAAGMRRVAVTIILGPRKRAADPDAYFKSLLDALVKTGLLIDDRRQCVELLPVEFRRGPDNATVIELEDMA